MEERAQENGRTGRETMGTHTQEDRRREDKKYKKSNWREDENARRAEDEAGTVRTDNNQ
jgi:hypothetical protein